MLLDFGIAIIFVLLLLGYGIKRSSQVQTEQEYLVADRKTALFPLVATLVMTEFNTATLLSFTSMGYLAGPFALWLPAIFLIGLVFYALTVAKKWKAYNGLSVASFLSERYGRDIGIMASTALTLAMLGFSGAYVKSLTLLFAPVFPLASHWILSGVFTVLVIVMALRGGLAAIIRTDQLAFWSVIVFFPLMALFAIHYGKGGVVVIESPTTQLPPRFIFSLISLTMFTYILAPWYGQKIFSARTQRTAFFAVLLSALIVGVLYGLAVWSTWMLRTRGLIACDPQEALPALIQHVMPHGLRGLGYALLFAASATTLSGVWNAVISLVVGDFLPQRFKATPNRSILLTLVVAATCWLLANLIVDRVFDKLILANIPIAALSFALLGGFYWRRSSRVGAYFSIVIGWLFGVGTYLYYGEEGVYTWYWAVWGLPSIFLSGVIGSLLFPNKKEFSIIGINRY